MTPKRLVGFFTCAVLAVFLALPLAGQGNRGKAELKAGAGTITIDYGRPSLKGRDMLSQLKPGDSWRMGMNQSTTLTTPVDLTFGSTKVAKGSYSLFLTRDASDTFQLVLNSQTGQWGTEHDAAKDVTKIPLKKEAAPSAVETFTIDLKEAPGGGTFVMTWGTTKLSSDFKIGK
jgi:hypothetical protein